jgi:hypothetical protein
MRAFSTVTSAAISSGVGSPLTIVSLGSIGQLLDLPTPMSNWRCTRAQNASRSHSRASW